jgi:hypothetical protein
MGDIYRVTIVRESGTGESYESETVFEVAGGSALVARIAPGALSDALRAAGEQVPEVLQQQGPAPVGAVDIQDADKPKRNRRTKAQIAADEAAQAAGFRDAAHQAEAAAQQAGQPTTETAPIPPSEPAPPAPVQSFVEQQQAADRAAPPPATPPSTDGSTPVFNPFQQ